MYIHRSVHGLHTHAHTYFFQKGLHKVFDTHEGEAWSCVRRCLGWTLEMGFGLNIRNRFFMARSLPIFQVFGNALRHMVWLLGLFCARPAAGIQQSLWVPCRSGYSMMSISVNCDAASLWYQEIHWSWTPDPARHTPDAAPHTSEERGNTLAWASPGKLKPEVRSSPVMSSATNLPVQCQSVAFDISQCQRC